MILKWFLIQTLMLSVTTAYYGSMRHYHQPNKKLNVSFDAADKKYVRGCYFTNWAQYRPGRGKYVPEDYVPGLCTHILFAFGWMNDDFTVRAFDPADLPNDWAGAGLYRRLNDLKKTDKELKTLLSIGGWSFGTRLFKEMAKTSAGRDVFIKSAIKFVRDWSFDGIDIDWEYPSGSEDYINFANLIQEMKEACKSEAMKTGREVLLVTAAVSASKETIDSGYNVPAISNSFDLIFLMNYDFHGAWSNEIGFNSPLYPRKDMKEEEKVWNIDFAAKYWNEKGMPRDKIVVGIATYGRGWTMKNTSNPVVGSLGTPARVTPFTQEAGVASYYELCDMLAKGAVRHWHDEQQVPYLIDGDQFWSYDDKQSVKTKMNYIKKEKFAGAFVWTLDFDDFNAKCPLSNGEAYPLIGTIAKELADVTIPKPETVTTAPTKPTTVSTTKLITSIPVTVTTTVPPPAFCIGKSDGFYADADCNKFVLCLSDRFYSMSCPSGLHFSQSRQYCVRQIESDCVNVGSSTMIPKTKFICPSDGFFGDKENCSKFYRCVNNISYSFECPFGLTFHKDSLQCDHPDLSKCE
ncbi:unnamed protein product [Auanema sp. JU1783]|nr:unnamed protein product [Auanema sp. JU1783]